MRRIIKLTEHDLHRLINESVRRVLNEGRIQLPYHFAEDEYMKQNYDELLAELQNCEDVEYAQDFAQRMLAGQITVDGDYPDEGSLQACDDFINGTNR